jgi:hypothetical protein
MTQGYVYKVKPGTPAVASAVATALSATGTPIRRPTRPPIRPDSDVSRMRQLIFN